MGKQEVWAHAYVRMAAKSGTAGRRRCPDTMRAGWRRRRADGRREASRGRAQGCCRVFFFLRTRVPCRADLSTAFRDARWMHSFLCFQAPSRSTDGTRQLGHQTRAQHSRSGAAVFALRPPAGSPLISTPSLLSLPAFPLPFRPGSHEAHGGRLRQARRSLHRPRPAQVRFVSQGWVPGLCVPLSLPCLPGHTAPPALTKNKNKKTKTKTLPGASPSCWARTPPPTFSRPTMMRCPRRRSTNSMCQPSARASSSTSTTRRARSSFAFSGTPSNHRA